MVNPPGNDARGKCDCVRLQCCLVAVTVTSLEKGEFAQSWEMRMELLGHVVTPREVLGVHRFESLAGERPSRNAIGETGASACVSNCGQIVLVSEARSPFAVSGMCCQGIAMRRAKKQ